MNQQHKKETVSVAVKTELPEPTEEMEERIIEEDMQIEDDMDGYMVFEAMNLMHEYKQESEA